MQFLMILLCAVVAGEDTTTSTPEATVSVVDDNLALENADKIALLKALNETGGPGGTLENIRKDVERDSKAYRDHANCSYWDYDNTTVYANGRFRHEFAVLHTENEPHEVRYAGFIGDRYAPRPFVVTYLGGYGDQVLTKAEDSCKLLPSGVLQCELCVRTHFVFHDRPDLGCRDVPQDILEPIIPPRTSKTPNGYSLEDQTGVPDKPVAPEKGREELANLNVLPLLMHFGGAAGKVTTNRRKPSNTGNTENRDESRDQWVYDYRFTNVSNAIRFEHALLRSPGTPEQHEDIFGSIYWRSTSGDIYISYRQNSTGFYAESEWAKIRIYRSFWTMETPPNRFCKLAARPGVVAELLGQPH